MVMISLSTSPGCGPRFLAGWASSLSSRASQCGRTAWKKSSNWQKSSTSRSNIDASPHLMAPTQKEEFKGDKGLASPQTRNSGYIAVSVRPEDRKLYLDALAHASLTNDLGPFQTFMHRQLDGALDEYIDGLRDLLPGADEGGVSPQ